jgi:mannose-6-phosphate isomerase-like protein (cupin superfamily)
MSRRAFFIAGDRVVHIANPCGAAMVYHAVQYHVLPGEQVGPRMLERADTLIYVEAGTVEVMVNGLSALIPAGRFVRVPAKTWFAYRNDDEKAAVVLHRNSPVQRQRDGRSVTIHVTAA